jgi:hypothetical protein
MPHIVLTQEQAAILSKALEPVELRDSEGRVLARVLSPLDEAALARFRDREGKPRRYYPAAEVEARLKKLEEISQRETLDPIRVRELLDRMRAGEDV